MNIAQEDLNGWATLAARIKQTIYQAMRLPPSQVAGTLEEASHLAANLETRLDRAGADKPHAMPATRHEIPLALLDTPANRRYMEKLREAWDAGLAVDRERYGADIGTDGCAQVIEMVLRDVEQEIGGAVGAGLE